MRRIKFFDALEFSDDRATGLESYTPAGIALRLFLWACVLVAVTALCLGCEVRSAVDVTDGRVVGTHSVHYIELQGKDEGGRVGYARIYTGADYDGYSTGDKYPR